jgi:hypothetical protein
MSLVSEAKTSLTKYWKQSAVWGSFLAAAWAVRNYVPAAKAWFL